MHQKLPTLYSETLRLTWLNYRWFLTTRVGEDINRHTVSRELLSFAQRTPDGCQSLLPTTQSSPTAFVPLWSFVINIFLSLDFLPPFSNSYITVSCRAPYIKAPTLASKLPKLQAASDRAGIAWHQHGAGHQRHGRGHPQHCGTAITGSKPLLRRSCSPTPPSFSISLLNPPGHQNINPVCLFSL